MAKLGQKHSIEEIRNVICQIDQDQSGAINLEEFLTFMTNKQNKDNNKAELQEAFKLFDADGCGYITV